MVFGGAELLRNENFCSKTVEHGIYVLQIRLRAHQAIRGGETSWTLRAVPRVSRFGFPSRLLLKGVAYHGHREG